MVQTVHQKKWSPNNNSKKSEDKEKLETNFSQKGDKEKDGEKKNTSCYCYGDPECLLPMCPKKDSIPKKEWFRETHKVHAQCVAGVATDEAELSVKLGFSGLQVSEEPKEPEVILDSGSTISLSW